MSCPHFVTTENGRSTTEWPGRWWRGSKALDARHHLQMENTDALSIARSLAQDDTAAVRSAFDATMAASPVVSDSELRRVWKSVVDQVGAFVGADDPVAYTIYHV